MKKAYFIDLDNTLYFTEPNAEILLGGIYRLLEQEDLGISKTEFEKAKEEMLRIPFQKIAAKYKFKEDAVQHALTFLKNKELTIPMDVHGEYHYIKALKGIKIIVTAGFEKTQLSKVKMLGIENDFDEVFIVDNTKTDGNKKDAFLQLLKKYKLAPADVMVIGDDAESEIKFGLELGMETFLYDPKAYFPNAATTYRATTLKDLEQLG